MGPRFCKRGNIREVARTAIASSLQWGHAFVSVETCLVRQNRAAAQVLQWGHAFVSVETNIAEAYLCAQEEELQWGHAFVSVETSSSPLGRAALS